MFEIVPLTPAAVYWRWPWTTRARWRERNAWRRELLHRLLTEILPAEPYQFESALSFLQAGEWPAGPEGRALGGKLAAGDPGAHDGGGGPIRLDLFYHTLPLAVDVVGADGSPRFHEAAPYLTRAAWSEGQRRLALKRERLKRYQCPYLLLTPDEPTDTASLKTRVKEWLGHNL